MCRVTRRRAQGHPLGIDVGGSGIKGAPVDLETGEFAEHRRRIATPTPSTPEAVAEVIGEIAEHFADATGGAPVGVTLPSVVRHGMVRTAANVDKTWIGTDAELLLRERLGRAAVVVNDADAAGVGELRYGAARATGGLVLLATLGTGIGSALLYDGVLVPNSELGHIELGDSDDAEQWASSRVKKEEKLSWEEWAERLQRYFGHIEDLLNPDLIVVGGGVSKDAEHFLPLLHLRAPIVPAQLGNAAGIVGAAWLAAQADGNG